MGSKLVLALDQGTTSSRALLIDATGAVLAAASEPFEQIYPQPGWVEHDPEQIWESQLRAARRAVALAGVRPQRIAAIGITNQRETALVWDRTTGRPIANAIVWQCRRTAAACEALRAAGTEATIRARTGLVLDAYFSATKITWLLDHVPGARSRAERGELAFGTVDSWLLWRLTGGAAHATDRSNASRTMLYNLQTDRWDDELCRVLRVPREMLPNVQPSASEFGVAAAGWLGAPIPITGIAGDQQAALFGQGCVSPGQTKNTYGTGCFVLRRLGWLSLPGDAGLVTTAAATIGSAPAFALEGSIFIAGAAVQWLRDGLGIIKTAAEVESLAAGVPDSGGVSFVPAFVGLGAPHWDAAARGTIVGLTRGSTAAHIARATLEAIAWQTREVVDLFDRESSSCDELRVDGGASANDLLMQLQADFLGRPVLRPRNLETTALGAGFLAGIAAGVWSREDEVASLCEVEREFEPRLAADEREARYAQWKRAVDRSRNWAEPMPSP